MVINTKKKTEKVNAINNMLKFNLSNGYKLILNRPVNRVTGKPERLSGSFNFRLINAVGINGMRFISYGKINPQMFTSVEWEILSNHLKHCSEIQYKRFKEKQNGDNN